MGRKRDYGAQGQKGGHLEQSVQTMTDRDSVIKLGRSRLHDVVTRLTERGLNVAGEGDSSQGDGGARVELGTTGEKQLDRVGRGSPKSWRASHGYGGVGSYLV